MQNLIRKSRTMRKFTIEQYSQMAARFNKKTFPEKIKLLQENSDILTLASDHNWWRVKVKDPYIKDQMEDKGEAFEIKQEWRSDEMDALVFLLGIGNTDYD